MEIPVLIFARAPVPGECKTRLIPDLGAEGAAALHARLVEHALQIAIESEVGPVSLCCAGDLDHPFFANCAEKFGVSLQRQSEGDLGARMLQAFVHAGGPALLAGSDAPSITQQHWRDCAQALTAHDAVFLSAEDGGYALIGLQKPGSAIFRNMVWSTSEVMAQTRARMRAMQMTWTEPAVVWDVDDANGLERLRASGLIGAF